MNTTLRIAATCGILFGASLAACGGESTPPSADPAPDGSTSTPPAPPPPAATSSLDAAPPPSDAGGDLDAADAGDAGDAAALDYCGFRTGKCGRTAAACAEERTCFGAMRAGAGASIESCVLASNKCNYVDDCIGAEALKYAAVADAKAYTDACLAKRTSCGASGGPTDDSCVDFRVFGGATLAALQTCLAEPCATVKTCLQSELAKVGCK